MKPVNLLTVQKPGYGLKKSKQRLLTIHLRLDANVVTNIILHGYATNDKLAINSTTIDKNT